MRLSEIRQAIFEGYREAQADFERSAGPDLVRSTIDQYRELVQRNQFTGAQKNIDHWRSLGWEAFRSAVERASGVTSVTQKKRSATAGRSIRLYESDRWLIVIPLDSNASCFHGKNTSWCISSPFSGWFSTYHAEGTTTIIMLEKPTGRNWAISGATSDMIRGRISDTDRIEFRNGQNEQLDQYQFRRDTGVDYQRIIELVPPHGEELNSSQKTLRDRVAQVRAQIKKTRGRDHELEREIIDLDVPSVAESYILATGPGAFPRSLALLSISATSYPGILEYIENPPDSVIRRVIRINPQLLKVLDQPLPDSLQAVAVETDPYNIEFLRSTSDEIQVRVLSENPYLIDRVRGLSQAGALAAIEADPIQITNIERPTPDMIQLAVKLDPDLGLRYPGYQGR